MRKKHLHPGAAALLGLGLFFAACSKNDNPAPSATPNELKLEAHAWNITAATFSDTAVTDSVFYTTCMEDDSLTFGSNHNFNFSDGATACDSAVLPYGSGSWAFNLAEDSVALKYNDTTLKWQVKALTDSTFQVSYADSLNHRTGMKTLSFAAKP